MCFRCGEMHKYAYSLVQLISCNDIEVFEKHEHQHSTFSLLYGKYASVLLYTSEERKKILTPVVGNFQVHLMNLTKGEARSEFWQAA